MKSYISKFKIILIFSIIIFGVLVLAKISQAATINTASCSYADVSAAITAASSGDTVTVPAGTCTWSTTVSITKPITLQGAGASSTVITGAVGSSNYMINYVPSPASSILMRVTGFTFNANNNSRTFRAYSTSLSPIHNIRYDHNILQNGLGGAYEPFAVNGHIYGVMDNNTISGNLHIDRDGTQRAAWDNLTFTFGTADNFYIEDNTFTGVPNNVAPVGSGWGSRYVFRYNTLTALDNMYPLLDFHGNQLSQVTGTMGVEIYGNSITCVDAIDTLKVHARGGKAMIFFNKATSCYNLYLALVEECADNLTTTNYTSGLFSGASDGQPFHISDTYIWNNRKGTTLQQPSVEEDCCTGSTGNCGAANPACCYNGAGQPAIKENTDWWKQPTSFDGTVGVGCGTLASRPATCTTGVGYWATDQNCTTIAAANIGADAATPLSGTLYKCTATNTWTSYYTPYTYPHPLTVSAAPPDTTPPSPPSGVSVN